MEEDRKDMVAEENTAATEEQEQGTEKTSPMQNYKKQVEETRAKIKEAREAIATGKGVLDLEKPILADDTEVTKLSYDFTTLTGMEYADAMDSDQNARQLQGITYRQGLALFAQAAAKQTPQVDMRDIIERIGMTDAATGVQLATLFFNASMRAGQMRISKKL